MHETRFINEIITVLKQKLGQDISSKGVLVNVCLSPFSHVTAEGLQKTFKELIKAEDFKSVSLNVLPLKLELKCKNCRRVTHITEKLFACPFCASADISIEMDKEFFVESIEID
jgi:Zn finger protein HypA/HybF involved in hydrogenase expression